MKKILFVHSSAELYGSDRSLLNIVKYLDKKTIQIFVILPCHGPLEEQMQQVPNVYVEISQLAVLRRKNLSVRGSIEYINSFRKSYRYLKLFIQEKKIDAVYTNTSVIFPGAVAAKHTGIGSVWHVREIMKNRMENIVISKMISHYADVVIANSRETAKALKIPQNKIRVIYNAVEEKENAQIVPHDRLTVGMAGRINRWKGQKLFVDAAEQVHREFPEAVFKLAGCAYTGEEYLEKELREYIHSKGLQNVVTLCGQIEDMDSFYSSLDVFVLPSIHPEPFGLVIIEAMEYGLPVIATNHGGPTEIIQDGVDGYLVDHLSCEEMACRIMELLKDEKMRRDMGINAQQKKRNMFCVRNMAQCIEEVLYNVLE
ncbi:MAG: glycosyltransferase family 4 protein [Lachnospiraceae bacterium]|nr:glycosyltransferase family 4 protein [Robinsoniella sp.]MDY3765643.1 glycosyltransferase family 4 protein [Lachnospiraceae bacterium]